MIDLDNNTVTLKESANQQEQACSASVPLTGTFIPEGKNVRANGHASTSEGSVQPPAGNLPSRYPKNKEVALNQSLLILVLRDLINIKKHLQEWKCLSSLCT